LDSVFKVFNFFDTQEFFLILITIIWLGFSWRAGMRLFYILALSHIINMGLKHGFALPRPFHIDPTLGIIHVGGYGFPSGAAQNALLLSGLLIMYWKSRWSWLVAAVYTLCISFSRLYLGVHFPLDILGGWLAGILLLGLYCLLVPAVESLIQKLTPLQALIINQSLLVILIACWPTGTIISLSACAMGLGVGVFLNQCFHLFLPSPKSWIEFAIRIAIGIIGIFILYNLIFARLPLHSMIALFFLFFSIGLWISFFASYICNKISLRLD
jgi:undecaprenyl-diphosphatase